MQRLSYLLAFRSEYPDELPGEVERGGGTHLFVVVESFPTRLVEVVGIGNARCPSGCRFGFVLLSLIHI